MAQMAQHLLAALFPLCYPPFSANFYRTAQTVPPQRSITSHYRRTVGATLSLFLGVLLALWPPCIFNF